MTRKNAAELDAVLHALADSTRRTILEELSNRNEQALFEICVRLVEGYGLSIKRQSISKHLAVLENAGLIHTSWQGRTKLHSTNLPSVVPLITQWLNNHTQDSL
ncbi:MAG: helix-turn-helix domain-containing protein [Pirellulaceae bacterium]|nr:helix-turn-helix domain-containing protein [Pirellulaceae bacterium]